jgi:hypothetical protein
MMCSLTRAHVTGGSAHSLPGSRVGDLLWVPQRHRGFQESATIISLVRTRPRALDEIETEIDQLPRVAYEFRHG